MAQFKVIKVPKLRKASVIRGLLQNPRALSHNDNSCADLGCNCSCSSSSHHTIDGAYIKGYILK